MNNVRTHHEQRDGISGFSATTVLWRAGHCTTRIYSPPSPAVGIVFEVSNLRAGDKTRPGDVVWLHFLGPGQHLLIDVSITDGVYRDAVLDDVSRVEPGYFAAKAREDAKLDEDTLDQPALFLSAMEVVID